MRKLTNEQFIEQIREIVGEEYVFLEEYKGNSIAIMVRHVTCKHEYPTKPANIKSGRRCPNCSSRNPKGLDKIVKDVSDQVGDEYEVLSIERKKGKQYINIKHSFCEKEYPVRYDAFVQKGDRCKCNSRKTHDEFVKEVHSMYEDEYKVTGKYDGSSNGVRIVHMTCGYEWSPMPSNFLKGKSCPRCADCERKTTDRFKEQVLEMVGEEYSVLGEYQGARSQIPMIHNKCKKEWNTVTPDNFLRGNRCPYCQDSKGNVEVLRVLASLGLDHDREYRFIDCRYKKPLPFDAVVFEEGEVKLLIEFDGIQHSQSSEFHGGDKGFEEIQIRDGIKNKYCMDNDIPLLRIDYKDLDLIEVLIRRKLERMGLIKTLAIV